jgi:acetyl-CoA synthetase
VASPRSATRPFPDVQAAVYDEAGNNRVGAGAGGYLVLERPWPAMLRGIYGDDAHYRETCWSKFAGAYFAGDGARVDEDGDFWLLGRADDVMNVSGYRISTIEVESALVDHLDVAEAAVCGRVDPMTGQAIVAYVTLKGGREGSVGELEILREHVSKKIGPVAKPANIRVHAGAAEDAQWQDHAPTPPRRCRHAPAGRHHHARRPDRRRRTQSPSLQHESDE